VEAKTKKRTPWPPSLGMATRTIRYWDVIIKRQGKSEPFNLVLNVYFMKSDVDKEAHDCALSVQECIRKLNFSRQNLKDVVANVKEHRGHYEVELAQAIVEKRNPGYKEGEIFDRVENEILVEKEVKVRDNSKTAQISLRKMGPLIRGHIKPYTLKRSKLMHVEVPSNNETTWTKIEDKEEVENHLVARNVEKFSHAGATPFGLTDLGKELGQTGDIAMAEYILYGTLEHECMKDEAIRAIVQQLKRHPTIQGILTSIVSTKDFQSCFKCVPEKNASSYSGRSVPHYKACEDGSKDGVADSLAEIHAAMATIPLETGFSPERWRHPVDIMLEKIPRVARTHKFRIIQLLKADLKQVLRAAFARNITKLAQNHKGVISEHQYRR
jgi:hypothetical protein